MEKSPLQQIVERLKQANTVLVTVNKNPTVDQLAACIGLTLFINKMNKHAAAVFSGQVPQNISFLEPDKTLEVNTDSLRDFIISLDKEKADKLRYKVEDDVVKIFITPYKTSLSQEDFDFTQGDFNVEAVVALGVTNRDELDESIVAHGRILHDATVIGISIGEIKSELGSINWHEPAASSLSELAARLCAQIDSHNFDGQIATALMTGIIAETDRFRNTKTTPQVMQLSAQLMAAGANQQLIADKLEEPPEEPEPIGGLDIGAGQPIIETSENLEQADDIVVDENGSLSINHNESLNETEDKPLDESNGSSDEANSDNKNKEDNPSEPENERHEEVTRQRIETRPADDVPLTSNTKPEQDLNEPSTDGLSIPPSNNVPLMTRGKIIQPPSPEPEPLTLEPPTPEPLALPVLDEVKPEEPSVPQVQDASPPLVLPEPVTEEKLPEQTPLEPAKPQPADTLEEIEKLIGSTHAAIAPEDKSIDESEARQSVSEATAEQVKLEPPASLNALPAIENINTAPPAAVPPTPVVQDPNSPPPLPPPMMTPQFFDTDGSVHDPYAK
ncbi:MAG: hypothetical protein M3Q79_02895 [bacterium]|nr:hypothetical protein [bacterium]